MTARQAGRTDGELSADLRALRDDIADLIVTLKDTGESGVMSVTEAATNASKRLSKRMRKSAAIAGKASRAAVDGVERTVTDRPILSLVAALGAGFLLGLFARR